MNLRQGGRRWSIPWTRQGGSGALATGAGARAGVCAHRILKGELQGGSLTHPLSHGALGAWLSTQSLCGREERSESAVGVSDPEPPSLPRILHPGPIQYSLSHPFLLGGQRFLGVQWGLGVPEQQDRVSALSWGRVERAGTWGAEGLG